MTITDTKVKVNNISPTHLLRMSEKNMEQIIDSGIARDIINSNPRAETAKTKAIMPITIRKNNEKYFRELIFLNPTTRAPETIAIIKTNSK